MMQRKERYPLRRLHINLRRGDFEKLHYLHGREGAGRVIRRLVIDYLKDKKLPHQLDLPLENDDV